MGLLIHGCPKTPPNVRHPKSDSSRTPPERWPHEWPEWAMRLLLKVLVSPKWTPRQKLFHLNIAAQCFFIAAQCFFLQRNVFLLQCKVSPHFVFYEVKPTFRDSDFLHRNLFWLQCKVLGPVMQNIAPQCFFVALACCTAIFICCTVPCCFSTRQAPLFQEATSTPQWWVLERFRKSPQGILEGAGGVLLTTMNQVYLASW